MNEEKTFELVMENLMRGAMARFGQLLEVVMTSVGYNAIVLAMSVYAVHTVRTARTAFDYTVALYIVAASMFVAAKGAELIHQRKWAEYDLIEKQAEAKSPEALVNPSVHVAAQSRANVKIVNIGLVATLALFAVVVSCWEIFGLVSILGALGRILPPLVLAIYAGYCWASFSK